MSGRTVRFHMCYVAVSNISNFAVFPPTENVNGKIKLPLYYAYIQTCTTNYKYTCVKNISFNE